MRRSGGESDDSEVRGLWGERRCEETRKFKKKKKKMRKRKKDRKKRKKRGRRRPEEKN